MHPNEGILNVSTSEPHIFNGSHRSWQIGYSRDSIPTVYRVSTCSMSPQDNLEITLPFSYVGTSVIPEKPSLIRFTPLSNNIKHRENVHFDEAVLSQAAGLYCCAARQYQRAIETQPYSIAAKVNLGVVWYQLQEWDKAIALFKTVLKDASPMYHHSAIKLTFVMLYLAYFAADRPATAKAAFRAEMRYLQKYLAKTLSGRGQIELHAGRFEDAIRTFSEAIEAIVLSVEEGSLFDAPCAWLINYYKHRATANLCLGRWAEVKADRLVMQAMAKRLCKTHGLEPYPAPHFQSLKAFEKQYNVTVPTDIQALLLYPEPWLGRLFAGEHPITPELKPLEELLTALEHTADT